MLELKDVSKFYYNKGMITSGFTKINLKLKMGEFVVITGESGSGKSTLLNVLSGLDSYEEGEMYINGKETSHYTEKDFEDYRRKYIANIFQSFNLVNSYTVYQNIELVLLLNGYKKKEIKKKVLEMIEKVELTKFRNTKVSKLSGGQKQRVAIARAMIKDTPIIVADEPTGNLDVNSAKDVIEILKNVAKDKLVIVVTHNIEQVESYATRIIKMHDGRILENKEIKHIIEPETIEKSKYTKLTVGNKFRLGIRNTFNILPKFLLLFAVFLFITIALLSEYASFKQNEYEVSKLGNNFYFRDLSDNRIIIKKEDNSYFTDKDYEEIEKLENINYIEKDDLILDSYVNLYKQDEDIYFYGKIKNYKMYKGNLTVGRMPESEYEAIIKMQEDYYYIRNGAEELLGKSFSTRLEDGYSEKDFKIKIVGVEVYKPDNNRYYYDTQTVFYVSDTILNNFRQDINKNYSTVKSLFAGKYYKSELANPYYRIMPSDIVKKGYAVMSDEANYLFSNYSAKNRSLKIEVENIYYKDELNLKVYNTYTKNTIQKLTGYSNYNENNGSIFINQEDYTNLFNRPSYQSSVFINDDKKTDNALESLQKLGIKAKSIKDFKAINNENELQIIKIYKLVITCILIFALFFISYFIIRIILKSRNVYFTTLRMLGATTKNVKKILDIELILNASIAYLSCMIFIIFNKLEVINIKFVQDLIEFLSPREYILMYVILVVMSILISRRFSRKIFKNSTIKTYNEEV